ncbi:hypothetical protein AYM40_30345 [Paraburkholderia phytofirmans OLGA172]|uniref:Aldehyde oxidase/xanthine dehydrogenase first molybdopterin binding domain-containing protein n=1 Tax=Paraburkholderia phytofirmans OLGA172 TaxID=1417228 RepID=A0A167WG33_9BURK|nr:hypothetical protein AYM40_30345 [Paraburkholderia phytofirmans OLGA172]
MLDMPKNRVRCIHVEGSGCYGHNGADDVAGHAALFALPLYAVPNIRVENNFSPTMPLRTSALRGLGAHMNVFSIESFMDEIAMAAHVDPVQFRLTHLDDQRPIDVIKLAAKEFGWPRTPRHPRAGVGFAFAKYKNLMAYVVIAVDIR